MPGLPPLPADNTKRYRLTYNNGIDQHSITMRVADTVGDAPAADEMNALMVAAAPLLFLTTPVKFEVALHNSTVYTPVVGAVFATSWGTGTITSVDRPFALTFSGRGLTGRRNHLEFIGTKLKGDANAIYTVVENTGVSAVVQFLNASGGLFWLSIAGDATQWYPRATSKQNDHVIRKMRSA